MQDAAPPHIARSVNQLLYPHFFDNRIISQQFLAAWSARSLDMNSCDIWLWGQLKATVYCDPITYLFDLKEGIERYERNILQFMLILTVEHAILCFQMVADIIGLHIEHVLFTFVDYLCIFNKAMIRHLGGGFGNLLHFFFLGKIPIILFCCYPIFILFRCMVFAKTACKFQV